MRIVEYNGVPVRRQHRVSGGIRVVFYDRAPIVVSQADWAKNHRDRFFDDPSVTRSAVVHAKKKPRRTVGAISRLFGVR